MPERFCDEIQQQHALACQSPPVSDAVLLQVTTERREAVLTASSFRLPPDQCKGTADHLMNNTGRRLPVTLRVAQYKVYPYLPYSFNNQSCMERVDCRLQALKALSQPTIIPFDSF